MADVNGHSGDCWCHYIPHLIAVRPEQKTEASEISGGRELENGEACQILDGLDHEIVGEILEIVGVLRVEATDPHDLVADLNSGGIDASPVHGVGYLGHGGFQGSESSPAPTIEIPDPGRGGDEIIAVVDSGIVPDDDLPEWLDEPNVRSERPIDTEALPLRHPVGHGTFVTSLIRRIAPEHRVSIASARPDPGYLVSKDPDHKPAPPPTDELNVLGAVLRLLRRHSDDGKLVRALNLSLGVHACPEEEYEQFVSLRTACELWMERFGDQAPIFAAAGNSLCPQPLYPAAFSRDSKFEGYIFSVAAARECARDGEIKVWDRGMEVPAPHRDWVTEAAPGCDVFGLSGQDPDYVVKWSGSSYATAVVSAGHVIGLSSDSDAAVRWWPDRAVTYRGVPNLIP